MIEQPQAVVAATQVDCFRPKLLVCHCHHTPLRLIRHNRTWSALRYIAAVHRIGARALLQVIGAGFGRTGTLSLKRALEILGYQRCYHFTTMLRERHTSDWLRITEGTKPDWTRMFSGYRATTDWPAAAYYKNIAAAYPQAKLILTVRDPDEWYRSVSRTIRRLRLAMPRWFPGSAAIIQLTDHVIWDGIFEGRFEDRQFAIDKFATHNQNVCDSVAENRLLVFDVCQGWEPLCRFLEVPVPVNVEFPHLNEARSIRWAILLVSVLPALLVFGGVLVIAWMVFGG